MSTLAKSKELSLEAIRQEVQALLISVTKMLEQTTQIHDQTLVAFKAEIEEFGEDYTKVREEIVSLRGLMIQKLQSMMQNVEEQNKMNRGRHEHILRMLRVFASHIDVWCVLRRDMKVLENRCLLFPGSAPSFDK
ncbi:hypothetical protein BWQ96_04721 [Gracilariopsis chorda]|uniref:Uncharacterized protein n=1 Tax=Gracilariopsis chorda TaxID=448386 RepID=A0A2V3ITU5_9FLOR|nr:hypothetical protein BWQ96_04721 [Gracilariopsis chorda]|eukprot:PXF45519.1 hypothetical protein BWQ96_04721 [Gracilariopsis chorda]